MRIGQTLCSLSLASAMLFPMAGCAAQNAQNEDGTQSAGPSVTAPAPNPGIEEKTLTHHGRTMDFVEYRPDAGRFPVVIFSHGYNGSLNDFDGTARFLSDYGIGSVALTFCGSGANDKSGFPTTQMTLFTERDDLSAMMDYVRAQAWFDGNLFLFGGSQGGMVSAMAAHERPADVAGMVLLFPGFSIPDDWNTRYPDDASVPETIDWWGVTLGRDFVLTLRGLNIYEDMATFSAPVLLMHGMNDTIVPYSYSERAAETYPNAELVTYSGEGHGFSPSTMNDVNERTLSFLDNILSTKRS